jgi:pyridoxamine 5'-phosphate oxidase
MHDSVELERWSTLDLIWRNAWASLVRGATDRKDAFHTMSVATLREDAAGNIAPTVRTVVVRKAEQEATTVLFHTDVRSAKFDELALHPQCSLLFYDVKRQLQIRLQTHATLHSTDALADERWAKSAVLSRRCYCGEETPGAASDVMTSGLTEELLRDNLTEEESLVGRKNFAVVECRVSEMELLIISFQGHRRARFRVEQGRTVVQTWLVP